MKAARVLRFGPPGVIMNDDLPRPEPAAGQLLVHVKAAGVGNWDALVRTTGQTMERLLELAEGSGLHAHIAMFHGEKINRTEDPAVLHVALHLRRLRKVAALEAQGVSP